ncbi:MAG: RHS domain-containing protein [Thermodesulfovibrionales bacterium]
MDVRKDSAPPVTSFEVGGPSYQAGSILYVGGTTSFSLSATDTGSGVQGSEYAVDGGSYSRYAGSFSLSSFGEGEHILTYRSTDNVANTEPEKSLSVILDRTAPATIITASDPLSEGGITTVSPAIRFQFLSTDGGSGVKDISYRIDGGAWNTYTGGFSLTGAGGHTIGYRAVDNMGNEEQEKSATVRLVELSVTKSISSRPVVLAGAWGDKKTTEAALNTLASFLNSSGYSYSLPSTEQEFKELLRAGRHTTYLLVDFDEEELMDELKGAVHYGDGLVYVKTKADDEHDLSELFGVQFKGMSTNKDMEVSFVQSELGGTMTLRSSGKAVKTALTSSAAKGLGTVKDKKESYPVVVSSQYGRGKTVLFAFDLLASSDQGTVSSLLTNALGFVAPSEPQVRALGEVPLLITLQNSAEPADVQVTETVPSDTGVESIVPDAAQTGSGMEWSSALSGNQDMSFEYSLVLPDRAGSYRTETEVRYGNGGEYRLYGQYALDISVTQGSTELLEEVLTALQGLVLSSKKDTERVNEALEELGDVEREASGRKEAEKNIGRITEALKELSEVSADVDSVRTKLEELLKVWQGKWSALPEEGKKDKEEKDKEKGKEHSSLLKGRKSVLVASLGSLSGLLNAAPAEEAMYFYHTDHLGTPILMTDERGRRCGRRSSCPSGRRTRSPAR